MIFLKNTVLMSEIIFAYKISVGKPKGRAGLGARK
jgi:hypothetical protein